MRVFAGILRSAERDLTANLSELGVQVWASTIWGLPVGTAPVGLEVEELFAGGLISYLSAARTPAAVRALRALASVAPPRYRARATKAADRAVAAGLPEAPWASLAKPARPVAAMLHEDPVDDDGVTVFVSFEGSVGDHTMGLYVDWNLGGMAKDAILLPKPTDEVALRLAESIVAQSPGTVLRPIPLAEAAARWREALEITDHTLDPPVSEGLPPLRPLLGARLRQMPAGGSVPSEPPPDEDELDELIDEFLASPFAQPLAARGIDPHTAGDLAWQCLTFGLSAVRGTPLRFSPVMVEIFCCDWAPRKVVGDRGTFRALPHVLAAWIRFVGDLRGLPAERVKEAVAAVRRYQGELRRRGTDPAAWGPAKAILQAMLERGVDLGDREAVQGFLDAVNAGKISVPIDVGP